MQTALGRWGPEGQRDKDRFGGDGFWSVRPESHHEGLLERLDKPQKTHTEEEEAAHSPGRKVGLNPPRPRRFLPLVGPSNFAPGYANRLQPEKPLLLADHGCLRPRSLSVRTRAISR